MDKEFGQTIIKRALTNHANREHIPVEEQINNYSATLKDQLEFKVPEIETILHTRQIKERKKVLKWIEESNTIPFGEPDMIGKLHSMMNKRPIYSNHFGGRIEDELDELIDQEKSDYKK